MGQIIENSRSVEGNNKRLKISVPHFDNSALIQGYTKTLVGRCMNPDEQDVKALVVTLPKIWKLETRVKGTDLGLGRFQFDFEKDEDIEAVLRMQPFHFDYWMLSLVRWQPRKERNYPSEITFWVKVLGVPLEFWAAQTFESIGKALGEWLEVDMDHGRIKVKLDGYKELRLEITVDFKGGEFHDGEEALISLRYEKLFGYCHICFSLCHKTELCPLNPKCLERKKESRDAISGKQDDRARSYKGVVINGNSGYQDKEKEHIDYVGKGKGKMYEEPESKWVKVPERDNTRTSNNRYSGRGDEGGSRNRNLNWETVRNHHPEERGRASRGMRGDRSPSRSVLKEASEKGEIIRKDLKRGHQEEVMTETFPALVGTLKVSVASENVEKAVALVNDTVGHRNQKLDEDVMDFDEHGVDVEGQDEVLCDAGRVEETEEEIEETDTFPEDLNAIT